MKFVPILFLSIIQLVCYVEGWISFFLNCIVKFLSRILFLFSIISFVWWPLDMLCGFLWAGCEYAKQRIMGNRMEFTDALALYTQLYPKL